MEKTVVCSDREGKQHIVAVDKLVFRPSVYGVLIENGKVLLSPQWDGYDFPGGGQGIDESIDQALEREVWEETGLRIKRDKVIACETSFFVLGSNGQAVNATIMYFTLKKLGGELSTENFDEFEKQYAKKAEWIPLERVEKLKFYNSIDSAAVIRKAAKMVG